MLTKHGVAKLADVGLASMIDGFSSGAAGVFGNFSHAAPEVLLGDKCTTKVGHLSWSSLPFRGLGVDFRSYFKTNPMGQAGC